jgi:hypothetical protein
MLDRSSQDVSDCFNAAVRMPWETGQIILGNVVAEIIEQKERVEIRGVTETKGPPQMDAGTFERWFRSDQLFNRSNRHGKPPLMGKFTRRQTRMHGESISWQARASCSQVESDVVDGVAADQRTLGEMIRSDASNWPAIFPDAVA